VIAGPPARSTNTADDGCQFYLTDDNNCGGCGLTCAFDEFCDEGACADICPGVGQELCGETCVDTISDDNNCGDCGTTCAFDEFCDQSACADICPGIGQAYCNEVCADTLTDETNCGTCGTTCAFDQSCEAGTCTDICPGPGQAFCSGVCADTFNDNSNCGACGTQCGLDEICEIGICTFVCTHDECDAMVPGRSTWARSLRGSHDSEAVSHVSFSEPVIDPVPAPVSSRGERLRARPDHVRAPRTARSAIRRQPVLQVDTPQAVAPLGVVEAPVCGIPPITEEIPDGESFSLCQSGSRVGREIFTTVTVMKDGVTVGQGPCALIVPNTEAIMQPFVPALESVIVLDESGDGLLQPGETAEVIIEVLNVGTAEMLNPVGVLSGAPDTFNPLPVTLLNDTSVYPDFPALDGSADCETTPAFEPQKNIVNFILSIPVDQEPDIGRLFNLNIQGDVDGLISVDMPLVLGIGRSCDPATDSNGEAYDSVEGLLPPVNVDLVPTNRPANIAPGSFSHGSTIRMKFRLKCGSAILDPADIELPPRIISIVHDTLGDVPLSLINANNNDNPNDPLFDCGNNRCEFGLRTADLPPGTIVVSIKMPDSRVFHAAMTTVE